MLNKFEFVTASPTKSFDSSTNSKCRTSLNNCSLFSAVQRIVIRKRRILRNMEL